MFWRVCRVRSSERPRCRVLVGVTSIAFLVSLGFTADPAEAARPKSSSATKGTQTGLASFYARKFQGRKSANGERHDNRALTAAHPSLPLGSRVRVTNLENRESVVVRITDRGPSRRNRREGVIIDMSRAAASRLNMRREGRARVRVEVLKRRSQQEMRAPAA
jgi:rare lipoprotein A